MNCQEYIRQFAALSLEEKVTLLTSLSFELTILTREYYEPGTENLTDPIRVRRLNELQHRLTSWLLAVLQENPGRYPEDVLVKILLDHPTDRMLQEKLEHVFAGLLQRMTPAA